MSKVITDIPLQQLAPHPKNREVVTSGEEWESFKESIAKHGVITPLMVRYVGPDEYQIVAGERRFRALDELDRVSAPCVVRQLSPEEALVLLLLENLKREDIDPLEEARGVQLLIEEAGLSEEEVCERICESAEWVKLRQGLLQLPEEAREVVRSRDLSLGVIQMVLHLPVERRDEGLQMVLHPAFQEAPLNARQAERILESEIIAPARARAEWEARKGELRTRWAVELNKVKDRASEDEPLVQCAEFEEAAKGQDALDRVYRSDLTEGAPEGVTWLHLAQRHGLPVRVFPGKVKQEKEELDDSVALVDHSLVLAGEKALEEHEAGSAWLRDAVKRAGGDAETLDPDAREDQEELDREEEREAPMKESGGSLSGFVDIGKIKAARGIFMRFVDPEETEIEDVPEWFPEHWGEWGIEEARVALEVLDWVLSLQGGSE